jgi:ABC-type multidrug transport system ATPase subunit
MFLYFFSFLISKEEQAQKSYFVLLFLILIAIPLISFIIINYLTKILKIEELVFKILDYFYKPYFITIAEITPITSLMIALFRIYTSIYFYYKRKDDYEDDMIPKPYVLIITHCIYLFVEFFIWGLLIHLCEIGYLTDLWNKFLKSYCLNKEYEFSTEVPVNDGFIIQDNLPNYNTQNNNIPNYNPPNYNTQNNNTPQIINNNTPQIINNESENNLINDNDFDSNNNSMNNPLINNINIEQNNNNQLMGNKYVQEQIEKVNNNIDLTTRIVGLTKTFCFCCKKNLRAVNNLYLGLEANEKFGLLGFNGSGKSTTFKCITNELFYDSGEITLFGYNNKTSFNKLRTMIGYCPQENPLFDYLTVRELLSFYKSLKRSNISIEDTCNKFGIGKYIDKYCVDLSGGNKRKLTFAIALMNYPKILLLDEPSTGVDPESRRIMWKNINELSSTGNEYNMILTTHSMEEAEILCDTVSWLRSGNFVCVGNPEKLKISYSSGYKLHIKFKDDKIKDLINNENFQHKNLCDLKIEGADFIMSVIDKYQNLGFYVDALYDTLSLICDKCNKISTTEIGKDFSFELKIHVKKDKQGLLFAQILNMKSLNELISEININMEPLENILIQP